MLKQQLADQEEVINGLRNRLTVQDGGHSVLIEQLKNEVVAGSTMISQLVDELNACKEQLSRQDNGLGAEFDFGRRVYQCTVEAPGVGYRHTPQFGDKNQDGTGPEAPQVIVADRICQGPSAVFLRCTSGRGWLPVSTPDGTTRVFKHLGKESELNLVDFEMSDGENKISKSRWFKGQAQDQLSSPKGKP